MVSDQYLKSKHCMFELYEVFDNRHFSERIFPVVLEDAKIYEPISFLSYVRFWQNKREELNAAIHEVGEMTNLHGIHEDLDLYDRIGDWIARLANTLRDMKTLNLKAHRDSGFAEIIEAVGQQVA